MHKSTKIALGIAIVALVVAIGSFLYTPNDDIASATPGSNAIENYLPIVKYNGGIYSELPIQTTSDITGVGLSGTTITGTTITGTNLVSTGSTTVGTAFNAANATSTLADTVHNSAATTTVKVLSSSSTKGGCIQMNATSSATSVRLMFSPIATTTGAGTYAGLVAFDFGTCE